MTKIGSDVIRKVAPFQYSVTRQSEYKHSFWIDVRKHIKNRQLLKNIDHLAKFEENKVKLSFKSEMDANRALNYIQRLGGKKPDRVSPLESFSATRKPGEIPQSITLRLLHILKNTRKNISEALSDMKIMEALITMDSEIKSFRDEFYPKMTQSQRLDTEYLIQDMIKNLESYAKRRLGHVPGESLTW